MSDLFPDGKENKKTLVIKSNQFIRLLLTYLHVLIFFSLLQQRVFGPSNNVSLKNKNAKYTTAQQQQPMDYCLRRSLKIRQFVEKIARYGDYGPMEINDEIKPFSCKFCDKSFHQVNEMKEHIKLHNSILEADDLRDQVKSLKTKVGELEVKLENSQKNELKTKAKVEGRQKIPEPGYDQNGVNENKEAKKSKRFPVDNICPTCSKKYSTMKILNRHMKEHTASDMFSCPDENCDQKFSRTDRLKDHSVVHTGEKPFSCSMCPRKFSGSKARNRHMKNKSCGK